MSTTKYTAERRDDHGEPGPMTAKLREQVALAGGLVSQADMARAWDISTPRVVELTRDPTFPEPVATIGKSRVWANVEVQAWRMERMRGRR